MKQLFRDLREALYYAYYRLREYEEDYYNDFPFKGPKNWDDLMFPLFIFSIYLYSILLVVFELIGWDNGEESIFYIMGGLVVLAIIISIKIDEKKLYKEMKKKYKNDPNRYNKGLAVLFFLLGAPLSFFIAIIICLLIDRFQ